MFVWEKGEVQSPPYLQYLTMMAQPGAQQGTKIKVDKTSKGPTLHGWNKKSYSIPGWWGTGQKQAQSGGWIKLPTLNPSTSGKPPLTLLPTSLCYDNWDFLMPHCQRNTQLFLEQIILQQLFTGFYKKQNHPPHAPTKPHNQKQLELVLMDPTAFFFLFFFLLMRSEKVNWKTT